MASSQLIRPAPDDLMRSPHEKLLLPVAGESVEMINHLSFEDRSETTGPDGLAVIDWYPAWSYRQVSLTCFKSGYGHVSLSQFTPEADGTFWIRLSKDVTVRGTVRHPDGTPAAGVQVEARQFSDQMKEPYDDPTSPKNELRRLHSKRIIQTSGIGKAETDANGHYVFRLPHIPDYAVIARKPGWISPMRADLSTWEGPVEDFDLTVQRATTVSGLMQLDGKPALPTSLPTGEHSIQVANRILQFVSPPRAVNPPPVPFSYPVQVEADSRYTIELGPGFYGIFRSGVGVPSGGRFEITDQETLEANFDAKTDRP